MKDTAYPYTFYSSEISKGNFTLRPFKGPDGEKEKFEFHRQYSNCWPLGLSEDLDH